MGKVNAIMLELLKLFPRFELEKLENRCNGNYYTKYFTAWQQLITLLFAQAGGKGSLRDIETSLSVHYSKWYHIGLKGVKRRTTAAMRNLDSGVMPTLFLPWMMDPSPEPMQASIRIPAAYRSPRLPLRSA